MFGQRLWRGAPAPPEDLVSGLGAMQAQEFVPAMWSVGQRCDSDATAVRAAVAAGRILRTHALRPTWHFVATNDLRWIQSVCAPHVHAMSARYYAQEGIDAAVVRKAKAVCQSALRGGNHLTRAALAPLFAKKRLPDSGLGLAYVLMHLELDAIICSGVPAGKQQTYALVDERAPNGDAPSRSEGLARLARRYFDTRGPATVHDFGKWASLPIADARAGLDAVRDGLVSETYDKLELWYAPGAVPRRPPSPRFDLVQMYDEITMSYTKSRSLLLSAIPETPPAQTQFLHAVLRDGLLVGQWKYAVRRDEVEVELWFHRPIGAGDRQAVDRAVRGFGDHLGAAASWRRVPAAP